MVDLAITGMGLVTPLGVGKEAFWDALVAGCSGIEEITDFDTSAFRSHKGGMVKGFKPKEFIPAMKVRRLDRASQFAIAATQMALEDAGLRIGEGIAAERIGIVLGSGFCGAVNTEEFHRGQVLRGPADLNPILFPNTVPNAAASNASIELGIKGPNSTVVQSFCTAEAAFLCACHLLRAGKADVMITGGVDELSPILYRGLDALRVLARDYGEGERSAPYDRKRNGFIPGEGGGVMVIERALDARRRGARVYAQVLGMAMATGGVPFEGVRRAITTSLARSGVDRVDLIEGCGNSSPSVDSTEARGLRYALSKGFDSTPVTSIKSMLGEGIASGGVRLVAAVLCLQHGLIPPTINYRYPDPACELAVVTKTTKAPIRTILHTGVSLDGTYVAIILGRGDGVSRCT